MPAGMALSRACEPRCTTTCAACDVLGKPSDRRRGDLINHDAADALALAHQVERLVDAGERHGVGDHRVDRDLAGHVPVDDLRHLRAAARAAERGAAPEAAGDELKRPCRDLLAGAGDADDNALAPAAM